MKNRFLSYIVSSLALCTMTFVSCEKEAEIPEVGTFGKSIAVTLPADKGNTVLTVNSDGQWFASLAPSTKDWASIDGNDSGVGKSSVKLSYSENNGMPRNAISILLMATTVILPLQLNLRKEKRRLPVLRRWTTLISKLSTSPKTNWPNYPDTSDGNKGKGKEVSINYLAIRYNK